MQRGLFLQGVFMRQRILFGLLALAISLCANAADISKVDASSAGIVGDGKTDNTAAVQTALDALGHAGGGTLQLGNGNFLFRGHLNIPAGVCLQGTWQSVPSHPGIRDKGFPVPTEGGTTLLVTEGRGSEAGSPFISMTNNCTLKGVVIYYPDQKPDETPAAYPYAISMHENNAAVLGVELVNPYNGINASGAHRHLIRDVQGQPIRRGIYVDAIYDIGRIENVHFNPWWCWKGVVKQFQLQHGQAFIFGRADWEYVYNTFCFGYNQGYNFIETSTGSCNGNFLGIGADDCWTAVQVDQSAVYGLLITNGEFTAFEGPNPTIVRVVAANEGAVRFVNCAYWGYRNRTADVAGKGIVGFSDCTFASWDKKVHGRADAEIRATGGTLLVRGCSFINKRPQVDLEPGVQRAIIADNVFGSPVEIQNHSKGQVAIHDNLAGVPTTAPTTQP
jgi:Pectate lyase superfamily protein